MLNRGNQVLKQSRNCESRIQNRTMKSLFNKFHIVVLALLALHTESTFSRSFEEASIEVRNLLELEREKIGEIKDTIGKERRDLRKEVKKIRKDGSKIQERISEHRDKNSLVLSEIDKLSSTNFNSTRVWERIWDSIKFNLTEFSDLYAIAFPNRKDLNALIKRIGSTEADARELSGILTSAIGFYKDFFEEASRTEASTESIYEESGELIEAKVLSVGLLGGSFQSDEGAGIIYRKVGAKHFHSQSEGLSKAQIDDIEGKIPKSKGFIPVHFDLSQGMALSQLKTQKGWKEFFQSGGLVMYPLILIGVIAVLIILERVCKYLLFSLSYRSLRIKVVDLVRDGKYDEAQEMANSHSGASRTYWRRGIELICKKSNNLEEAFHHLIVSQVPGIERFLSTLAVFAAICPLLGLLGTVSGMIKTFDVITIYGTSNSGMLAQGISEALVTTEVGLVLAIPILLAHSSLSRKAKSLIGQLDQTASRMIDLVETTK